jgi:phage-related protein
MAGVPQSVFDGVSGAFGWIINRLQAIADFFDDAAEWASDIPGVGGMLSSVFSSISTRFDWLAGYFDDLAYNIHRALSIIDSYLDDLISLGSAVYGWITDKLDDAYNFAVNAWSQVQEFGGQITDLWTEVFTSIPGTFSSLWDQVNQLIYQVFSSIPGTFSSLWDQVNQLIYQVFSSIPGTFSSLWDQVNQLIYQVFTSIPGTFSSLWDQVNQLIYQVFTSIPGSFSSLWDQVNQLIYQVFTSIPGSFSSLWDQVNQLIYQVFTSIPGTFSSLVDQIEALPDLIKDQVFQVIGPAIDLVELYFEDISGFFSDPSTYFSRKIDQLGKPFADGLWNVIEKIIEKVW